MSMFRAAMPRTPYRTGQIPLFMMHGYGSNEADLFMLASELPEDYYPVSIRGPLKLPWGGYAWFRLEWTPDGRWTYDRQEAVRMLHALEQWIAKWMEDRSLYHIKPALLGFSQGGIMSCAGLSRRPGHYGPVALLSTRHVDIVPLPSVFPRQLPVFMSHGLYDDVIPVEEARKSRKICAEKGMNITYKEYPQGHYLSEQNVRDLSQWLEKNKKTAFL